MHPNPNVQNLKSHLKHVNVINPLAYAEMIELLSKVKFVISDSGGIQEECASYRKKVLVCRNTTERPEGIDAGLEATSYYEPPTVTWAYASNAAIVEVNPATGQVLIENYVEVHDAGVLVNPAIADGQVKGGLVQGLGGGLLEEITYDENGQLLTGSFMDYLLPSASDVPPITVIHLETPSPLNSLGVKGLGEGGAIAPPVVIANAVCDALRPFKAEINSTPVRWGEVAAIFGDDPFKATSTTTTPEMEE